LIKKLKWFATNEIIFHDSNKKNPKTSEKTNIITRQIFSMCLGA